MGGRFLNKRFTVQDGISQGQGDDSPAFVFESGTAKVINGPMLIEKALTVSGAVTTGTLTVGANAGNNPIAAIWRTIYTWNVPAIQPGTGSVNDRVSQDVAMSGAAIGDPILVAAIGSCDFGLIFYGACYSAGVVNIRAQFVGSTGAYTPGNVPLKLVDVQI